MRTYLVAAKPGTAGLLPEEQEPILEQGANKMTGKTLVLNTKFTLLSTPVSGATGEHNGGNAVREAPAPDSKPTDARSPDGLAAACGTPVNRTIGLPMTESEEQHLSGEARSESLMREGSGS